MYVRITVNAKARGYYWRGSGYSFCRDTNDIFQGCMDEILHAVQEEKEVLGIEEFESLVLNAVHPTSDEQSRAGNWVGEFSDAKRPLLRWIRGEKVRPRAYQGVPIGEGS